MADPEIKTKIDVRRIRPSFCSKNWKLDRLAKKLFLDLMLIRKVFYLARTQKPDIIHGHLHEGVLVGWIVRKLLFWRKMKLVSDFHGSLTKEMVSHGYLGAGMLKKVFDFIEKTIDNLGDFAITSSWENTKEIQNFRKDGKLETILDGVDLDYYQKLPKENPKRARGPNGKNSRSMLGAFVANKGIDYLKKQFACA